LYYAQVAQAIAGKAPWPVTPDDALAVAKIIDQARAISIR